MSQDDHTDDDGLSGKRRVLIVLAVLGVIFAGGVGWFLLSGAQTTDPYAVTAGATYNATDGPEVELGEGLTNTTVGQPFPNEHRIDFYTGTWLYSEGQTELTLSGLEDEWTTAEDVDLHGNQLTFSMPNAQETNVSGGATHFEFRDVTLDDGADDLRYAADSTTTVTLKDVPADTTIVAWGPGSDTRLDYATSSSDGVLTLSLGSTSGTTDVRLHEANAPTIDDSTADPTDGQSTYPEYFSVGVDHEDFPGTAVDVEFFLDGSSIGTETLSSAGEANVSAPEGIGAGSHDWHVVATDDYGNTVDSRNDSTSGPYEFAVPDELEIRDEENPSQLVDEANATLEFYFGAEQDTIVERDATDGTVNMTGLPVDQSFIVLADAEGYHPRRVYVDSLFQSEQIYLLNESSEYAEVTFDLEDFTGDFPEADTVLKVQRNIGGDWETVQGDFFGATGQWTGQLSYNTRHRLILLNTETGQERNVGSFTPTSSGVQTIRVLDSDTEISGQQTTITVEPSIRTLPATDDASVTAIVSGEGRPIDHWDVTATFRNGSGSTTLLDETRTAEGNVTGTFDLRDRDGGRVVVDVTVTFEDGTTTEQRVVYRVAEYYDHDASLWATLTSAPGILGIGGGGMTFVAVVLTLLGTTSLAAFTPLSTEEVGIAAVAFTIVFAIIGWAEWRLVIIAAVTLAGMWGIWRGIS